MKRILVLGKGLVGESIRSYFENSPNEIRACSTEEVDLRVLQEEDYGFSFHTSTKRHPVRHVLLPQHSFSNIQN